MKKALLCLSLLSLFAYPARPQQASGAIYKDSKASISDRVHDLLGRMTVKEKVAQLESGWTMPSVGGFKFPSVFENGQIKEDMARKMAANGLGTYAFLDEFTGTTGSSDVRLGPKKPQYASSLGAQKHSAGNSDHVSR